MRFLKITGFLLASFYPKNEFQKAINAEMNPKIPVYLQRSSASSPPRRSRVFQWIPGWPSAGAATSAWCNRCRRTQLLHRQTNKGQTDLMLLINMIRCFYKSNKLSCTNYYTIIKLSSFTNHPLKVISLSKHGTTSRMSAIFTSLPF